MRTFILIGFFLANFGLFSQSLNLDSVWISKSFSTPFHELGYEMIEVDDGYILPMTFNYSWFPTDTSRGDFALLKLDNNLEVKDSIWISRMPASVMRASKIFYIDGHIYLLISDSKFIPPSFSQKRWFKIDNSDFTIKSVKTFITDTISIRRGGYQISTNRLAFLASQSFNRKIVEVDLDFNYLRLLDFLPSDSTQNYHWSTHSFSYLPSFNTYLLSADFDLVLYLNRTSGLIDSISNTYPINARGPSDFRTVGSSIYGITGSAGISPTHNKLFKIKNNGALDTVWHVPLAHGSINGKIPSENYFDVNQMHETFVFHLEIKAAKDHDIIVTKFDANQQLSWQKNFTVHYTPYIYENTDVVPLSIIATQDGGCVLTFTSQRVEDHVLPYRKLFVLKLNAQGHAISTKTFEIKNFEIKVFPNPGTDYFEISLENTPKNQSLRITLYNANGQPVKTESIEGNRHRVEASTLTSGIYFFEISNENGQSISRGKWVKE